MAVVYAGERNRIVAPDATIPDARLRSRGIGALLCSVLQFPGFTRRCSFWQRADGSVRGRVVERPKHVLIHLPTVATHLTD